MELKVENIYKEYNGQTVLDDVSFTVNEGQKIGLVGGNGTGKTTLLKILAGIIKSDSGKIVGKGNISTSYLPQDTSIVSNETIKDYLRRVSGIEELEKNITSSQDALIKYELRDGYIFSHRIDITLTGLGLSHLSSNEPIKLLSSGQKSKVFMAGVLLSDSDILLLDEPTNNLDIQSLIWLENFMDSCLSSIILVSHDRFFLDKVVNKIFELDWYSRTISITNGRYSDYLSQKEKVEKNQLIRHEDQREEIDRLTHRAEEKKAIAIQGSRYIGTDNDKLIRGFKRERAAKSSRTAKALEKRIDQMEIIEKPITKDVFSIDIDSASPSGPKNIILENLIIGYSTDNSLKIEPINLTIDYGRKLVILGSNGVGKSTLLKTISGQLKPISGNVIIGSGLLIGDLMQEHESLPRERSIIDYIKTKTNLSMKDIYTLIVRFGFKAEDARKKISNLSPGERTRLLMAEFTSLDINVLILDEPTNHLDLEALQALEKAVTKYLGTVILVSHDRQFLKEYNPSDILVLKDGKLEQQPSIDDYI